ncbi:MAG: helix-turn-helix domain-containing protein [Bacteroidetes bacterium]|nr:helix-turn-helix domain-containing protein [Bacteroidota bacterium]
MNTWKVIKTASEHKKAVKRAMEIFHAEPNTPEDDELGVLLLLIKDYEDRTVKMPEVDVLEIIKDKMQEQGIKNKDLEPIIGSKSYVSSILSGRRELTLKMATRLKDYFHLPAELFLQAS